MTYLCIAVAIMIWLMIGLFVLRSNQNICGWLTMLGDSRHGTEKYAIMGLVFFIVFWPATFFFRR